MSVGSVPEVLGTLACGGGGAVRAHACRSRAAPGEQVTSDSQRWRRQRKHPSDKETNISNGWISQAFETGWCVKNCHPERMSGGGGGVHSYSPGDASLLFHEFSVAGGITPRACLAPSWGRGHKTAQAPYAAPLQAGWSRD